MCGRFTLLSSIEVIRELLKAQKHPTLFDCDEVQPKRYNIAPTQPILAVRKDSENDTRYLLPLHWGLIPFWADDPSIGNRLINARAETAASKPAFRHAFSRHRCLIPADGFYEWKKDQNGKKQPYYLRMKDQKPFVFAGLWERWKQGDQTVESCTILTTDPNELVKPLHNRMPVILAEQHHEKWLDRELNNKDELVALLGPFSAREMESFPVSRKVNNPQNDDESCIQPMD